MKKLSWLVFGVVLAMSCQDDQDGEPLKEGTRETIDIQRSKDSSSGRLTTENGVNCEESLSFPVIVNGTDVGTTDISVDETEITISYDLTGNEWFLLSAYAIAGDCNGSIPEDPSDFPFGDAFSTDDEVRAYSLSIPLANLPDCGCVTRVTTVARFNPNTSSIESYELTDETEYCNCDEPDEPDDKNLRTQTPGGWGAPPNGNNPGVYLHANFAAAFPAGLVVGCDYTVTFTSAQAVTDGLPQGGTPSSLSMSYVDPVNSPKSSNNPKNTLVSHVVALTLSVTFDALDEDFGESATNLADAVVTSGDFEGWTVADILEEAEQILGGCPSDYSASEITEVLSSINETYVDGTTNTGFLQNQ